MNRMLSWAVAGGMAANVSYGFFAGSQSLEVQERAPARVQLRAEVLAPIAADLLVADKVQPSAVFVCLRLGPLGAREAPEALALLGTGTRAKLFENKEARDVRFGPWPKSDVPELERILGPWRPATIRPCDAKESEEWEKFK